MAEQGYEYEQYAPQASGRLFSSAMFGYNKEEVNEYIDELYYESEQRHEAAETQIQELTRRIQDLESAPVQTPQDSAELDAARRLANDLNGQIVQLGEDVEIAKAATQQSEEELAEVRDQLYTAQQESAWLRDEFKKTDEQIADLHRQLDSATAGQWVDSTGLEQRLAESEAKQAELNRRLLEAHSLLAQARDEAGAYNLRLDETQRQLEDSQTLLDASRSHLSESRGRTRELQARLDEFQARLDEKDRIMGESGQKLQNDLKDAARRLSEGGKRIDELQASLSAAVAESDSLKAELAARPSNETAAAAIIADANAEAERIRAMAYDEKERIRRQIKASAGGLAESITNLRGDLSGVEDGVTSVLEAMQTALADIMSALSRTEQNLNTLGVQVQRFPAQSAPVQKPQQVVYFQPTGRQPLEDAAPRRARPQPDSYGFGGFRRVVPDETPPAPSNLRPFRPAYTAGQPAAAWAQPADQQQPETQLGDERIRVLAENLVDTLVQMLS